MKISATIITLNEEKHIKKCLESLVDVADEIIVVDSFSTDRTEEICNSYEKVRFIQNQFLGHIQQKNYALDQVKNPLVLSLDADECLSNPLKDEILALKSRGLGLGQVYSMPRLNNYCGKWIRHSGWYPDRKVRLWDKNKGRWGGQNPHDSVVVDTEVVVKELNCDLLHYTISSLTGHVAQTNKFSEIAARQLLESKPETAAILKMIFDTPFTFIKKYILQLGL